MSPMNRQHLELILAPAPDGSKSVQVSMRGDPRPLTLRPLEEAEWPSPEREKVNSVLQHGVVLPIVLIPADNEDDADYCVVDGRRRFVAACRAVEESEQEMRVPALVLLDVPFGIAQQLSFVLNIVRGRNATSEFLAACEIIDSGEISLDSFEEGQEIKVLLQSLAGELGLPIRKVEAIFANALRLLNLPFHEEVLERLRNKKMAYSAVKALLRYGEDVALEAWAKVKKEAGDKKITTSLVQEIVQAVLKERQSQMPQPSPLTVEGKPMLPPPAIATAQQLLEAASAILAQEEQVPDDVLALLEEALARLREAYGL